MVGSSSNQQSLSLVDKGDVSTETAKWRGPTGREDWCSSEFPCGEPGHYSPRKMRRIHLQVQRLIAIFTAKDAENVELYSQPGRLAEICLE